jgi:AraC-like DNA-binding protein
MDMPSIGTHFDAPPALADVVKHFYCIQTDIDFESVRQDLSPNLEMMLVFNFGPPLRIAFGNEPFMGKEVINVGVLGPLRKMLHYEVVPETDLIVVTFNPNGFYRLFNISVEQMHPETIHDPDEMLGITGFQALWQALKGMQTTEDRIQLLIEHGSAFVQEAEEESIPLLAGLGDHKSMLAEPSKAIAVGAHLSERIVQMRFKKYMGFSSKELTRLLRFKQVIDFIQKQEKEVDWLTIVAQFGYYDQSHLIKDFKYYLDTTPRKFVQNFLGKTFCVSKPQK